MEKLPSGNLGFDPNATHPGGPIPDMLALPAASAPVIDVAPSAAATPGAPTREAVSFVVTDMPATPGAAPAENLGQATVIPAPEEGVAAPAEEPTPEAVPADPVRASRLRAAARNAGHFALRIGDVASKLDEKGVTDAVLAAGAGVGGKVGTVVRGAARATKAAAVANNARHAVQAAFQPSPTGEGVDDERTEPEARVQDPSGDNDNRVEGQPVAAADGPSQPAVPDRGALPAGPRPRQPRRTSGDNVGRAQVPRYPGDPDDRLARQSRRDMPQAFGPWNSSYEDGDVPRHLPLDEYLGLDPDVYARTMADTQPDANGLTGPQRLARLAAQQQRQAYERLKADRPVRGHVDINGDPIPVYGPALPPNVANGKQRTAVDRTQAPVYGENGAWMADPRTAETVVPAAGEPGDPIAAARARIEARNRDRAATAATAAARGIEDKKQYKHDLGPLERLARLKRRIFKGGNNPLGRRGTRRWDAARDAGFAEVDAAGGLDRDEVLDENLNDAGLPKGYLATEGEPGGSNQPINRKPPDPNRPPQHRRGRDGRRVPDPPERIDYEKLRITKN